MSYMCINMKAEDIDNLIKMATNIALKDTNPSLIKARKYFSNSINSPYHYYK